jgi:NADH-quinone oxidoreductase subunit L
MVNGTANLVGRISRMIRGMQTGRLYTYAFAMILGLIVLMAMIIRASAQ